MARALTLAALTETALALTALSALTGLSALALTALAALTETALTALALTTLSALAALTSLALRTLSALTGLASGCFARDAFLRLDHFLDRAVFVEEEFIDADGAAAKSRDLL